MNFDSSITITRNGPYKFYAGLRSDPFFFQYNHLIPGVKDEAKLDVTISGENNFMRRYVGAVRYENGELSFGNVVRLW